MATVPTYGGRKQTLKPVFTGKLESRATANSFGAQVGAGMQNLASGIGDLGDAFAAVQQMEDKAVVDEHVNKFSDYTRERTYDPEHGYVTQQGKNAVDGRATFEGDLETQRDEIGKDLTPAQKKAYGRATDARRRQALDTGIKHAATQRKSWFNDASTARLDTFANDALAMSEEPEKLALNMGAAEKEIADRAAVQGWSGEQTDVAQKEFRSGVHKNIVLKNAVTDPLMAKEWLDANRDDMTEAHQYELDKALDGPVLESQAQLEAERISEGEQDHRPPQARGKANVNIKTSKPSVDVANVKTDTKTAFGRLQGLLDQELTVNSGHRTTAENEAVGGAEGSRHIQGDALDIDVRGMSKAERLNFINKAFDAGFTGIGVGTNFIHLDQGNARSWGYVTASGGGAVPDYAAALVNQRVAQAKGGGNPTPAQQTPQRQSQTGAVDSGMAMLRQFEGMRTNTYWDVDHQRVGYGSDTRTDAQGRVHKTRKGDVVTQADAERDLARRTGIANNKLQKELGRDWSGLTPEARGALLSVDYNYGELPKGVKAAIRTGDTKEIAASVMALRGHNNGINAERRTKEASVISSGGLPEGVSVKQGYEFVGPQYIADQVAGISDPRLRAKTAAALSKKYNNQDAAQRRADRLNKLSAEKFIIQNPGMDPTKLPLNIQQQLGIDGMNTLWAYNDKVEQQGSIETDERLYAELQRLQAEDPRAFAEDVDLFDHIDKLSDPDRRALQQLQVNDIKDRKEGTDNALKDAKSISSAMSIADTRLEAAGVKKTGKASNEESQKREAQFQRALVDRMREFQKQNERVPNDYEVSDMVDELLLPIIIKEPGAWWGTNETDGNVFEAPNRPDNATVAVNVPYENIPVDVRLAIREELAIELGRDPNEDEVKAEYVEFVLSGK